MHKAERSHGKSSLVKTLPQLSGKRGKLEIPHPHSRKFGFHNFLPEVHAFFFNMSQDAPTPSPFPDLAPFLLSFVLSWEGWRYGTMECQGGEEGRVLLTLENAFLFFPERLEMVCCVPPFLFSFTHVEESTPQLCCEGSKTK